MKRVLFQYEKQYSDQLIKYNLQMIIIKYNHKLIRSIKEYDVQKIYIISYFNQIFHFIIYPQESKKELELIDQTLRKNKNYQIFQRNQSISNNVNYVRLIYLKQCFLSLIGRFSNLGKFTQSDLRHILFGLIQYQKGIIILKKKKIQIILGLF
ncbi:unnamed protein product (macronuclear) [Paramecium tetraurelia]|uniref:Transmembrane protein n=1 Tax=Paramecium tetraurelia TaxID=5888 RepID=A0D4U3_PARTE|nr:uncharacterized protein GSPATT00013507001 [Paramecium tetraurelia]CAK78060.1 unnamed protein product [Paramecium tetraurelia]|eukprot:XP_001445457.1 hypothetical protein (macronuclear) [Paramecium tetraurelia strain d4-2]